MRASRLNAECFCVPLDQEQLASVLHQEGVNLERSSYFASLPYFVDAEAVAEMQRLVTAFDGLAHSPAFLAKALADAPDIARFDPGSEGILHGLDFHLTERGPQLIEINTNAGGLLLNASRSLAQPLCCDSAPAESRLSSRSPGPLRARVLKAFLREFSLGALKERPLRTVAIVDEAPQTQFLHPEFQLFAELFRSSGLDAQIAAPEQLEHRDGGLWANGKRIDLVYNRLTDFYFEAPSSQALRSAYLASEVAVTPHPRAHALWANKRHLVTLSSRAELEALGVPEHDVQLFTRGVPHTELVITENRERLYHERKRYFFKPLAGYGSKAVYRGDKITRGKFDTLFDGNYVAQELVPPAERTVTVTGEHQRLKADLRAYVEGGQILLFAARLYQGQTTNFRTPGGGFASVLVPPSLPMVTEDLACKGPGCGT